MKITPYDFTNAKQVSDFFISVFTKSEGKSEGDMVGKLAYNLMTTTPSQDLFGFIAQDNATLLGAIFFSRLTFESNVNAFILSPVAVHSDYQGQGVGSKLIRYGLEALKKEGVELVTTYGDPDYYSRVGFRPLSTEEVRPPFSLSQPIGWLGQCLSESQSFSEKSVLSDFGKCSCVEALNKPEYW